MQFCLTQIAQRALLSIGVVLLGLPVQSLFADQMVQPSATYQLQDYYQYNYECGQPSCQYPCREQKCCYSNTAIVAGAVILGGVAGAIVGKGSSRRHSSSRGSGPCNNGGNEIIQRDVGQTIDVFVDIEITGLKGTTTFTLFSKGPDNIIIQGGTASRTNEVQNGMGPFEAIHLTLPTIQDPIIGTYNFWVEVTLTDGNHNDVETTVATFIIKPSRLSSPVGIFTPEAVSLTPPDPIFRVTQLSIEYNYTGK